LDMAELSLELSNGEYIAVQLYSPSAAPRAVVIVPCAMGVAQRYYARFAEWLSSQGYLAITFDYRGVGSSAPRTLRGLDVDLFGWAQLDCAAVIEYAKKLVPDAPLFWIGHSLGGQLLGLIPNRDTIDRVMTVATGSGYWLQNSWPTKRVVWWLWFVVVPITLRVVGYFPGKRLRKVGNLPKNVMAQWRRWCLRREYVVGAEGEHVRAAYASVRIPIVSISFTDDEMMSAEGVRSLHALYSSAPIEYRRIAPTDIGVPQIGHFGFFRPQFENTLWEMVKEWMEESKSVVGSP
jgi:predicted alpha/beta hydrolase